MSALRKVTITGAGMKTSFTHLERISRMFPLVEWAVLFSESTAGKENRYPTLEWLEKFATKANKARMQISLHLCGSIVKTLLAQATTRNFTPESQRILSLIERFDRVQLNTIAKEKDLESFKSLIAHIVRSENHTRVILQWNDNNAEMCRRLSFEHGFEALVDASGGRGIARESWPGMDVAPLHRIGFAGGLSPDNLAEQLPRIAEAAKHRTFWIDAEGQLRDEKDQLDLGRCEKFLAIARDWWAQDRNAAGTVHGKGFRKVNTLSGIWLDWWVAATQYLPIATMIPPVDAVAAMVLDRATGSFERPYLGAATTLFAHEQIALLPQSNDTWNAYALSDPDSVVSGPDLETAGYRAVVLKHFGDKVPKNPALVV